MRAMAEAIGAPYHVFTNMSPTIYGGAESLPAQSVEHLRKRKPFTGCNAGVYPSPGLTLVEQFRASPDASVGAPALSSRRHTDALLQLRRGLHRRF